MIRWKIAVIELVVPLEVRPHSPGAVDARVVFPKVMFNERNRNSTNSMLKWIIRELCLLGTLGNVHPSNISASHKATLHEGPKISRFSRFSWASASVSHIATEFQMDSDWKAGRTIVFVLAVRARTYQTAMAPPSEGKLSKKLWRSRAIK